MTAEQELAESFRNQAGAARVAAENLRAEADERDTQAAAYEAQAKELEAIAH